MQKICQNYEKNSKKILQSKIFKKGHLKTDQIHRESRMYVVLL